MNPKIVSTPIQDSYPEAFSHCYGCGRLNEAGLQLKTIWESDRAVSHFTPRPYHTAIEGTVYGGLLASLIDCHGTGTAALEMYRQQGRVPGTEPALRFVTASLKVDYLRPTPLGPELVLRGRATEIGRRKVIVAIDLYAGETLCVKGQVVAVLLPEDWSADAATTKAVE